MTAEAERLFQRAANSSRRRPPGQPPRAVAPGRGRGGYEPAHAGVPAQGPQIRAHRRNWDSDAWKRLQPEADKSDRSEALERTRKELDEQLAADAQRIKAFKIAGLALLGALGTSITEAPIYVGALVGAAVGFVVEPLRMRMGPAAGVPGPPAWPAEQPAPDPPMKLTEQRCNGAVELSGPRTATPTRGALGLAGAGRDPGERHRGRGPARGDTCCGRRSGGRLAHPAGPRTWSRGFSYALRSRSGEGDPGKDPDPAALYRLPWAHGQKHTVTQGYFGHVTHQGIYALDFDLDEGTPVLAARDGVVIAVKDDSDAGGMGAQFAGDGNYVRVMHDDATWAVYAHLRYHGAEVQVGQRVLAGQRLGFSGHTGLASGPHLHLAVYRASFDGPKTIPTVSSSSRLTRTASLQKRGAPTTPGRRGCRPSPSAWARTWTRAQAARRDPPAAATGVTFREERVDRRNLVWAGQRHGQGGCG